MKNKLIIICLLLFVELVSAQTITALQQGAYGSIRGLSVVNDKIAWTSGSKGHIGLSTDGGKNWAWQQVKGFEQSDFRDIEAFSDKEAIIMSSGTPALILKTTDSGISWKICYRNDDKAYFLDGIAFANARHGFVLGDPINGRFLLLETKDAGNTWNTVSNAPVAITGEAAFAASGTAIFADKKLLSVVTGGTVSRWFTSPVNNIKWTTVALPLSQGVDSKGAFSIAHGKKGDVIVGGDYAHPKTIDSVASFAATNPAGLDLAQQGPACFQSCVIYIDRSVFISTGTSGTNITTDGGRNWKYLDSHSYNVCKKARKGKLILLAGDKGSIAMCELQLSDN